MSCVRRWSAGIEKGGAGEGQVRAAPRSIVLSRGGAPGPVARRDETRRPAAAASVARTGEYGYAPLARRLGQGIPCPPPPPSFRHPPTPRSQETPWKRNGGAPILSRSEAAVSPCVTGARHVRISYTAHRAFARKCTRGHGGRRRRTFDAAGASDPLPPSESLL